MRAKAEEREKVIRVCRGLINYTEESAHVCILFDYLLSSDSIISMAELDSPARGEDSFNRQHDAVFVNGGTGCCCFNLPCFRSRRFNNWEQIPALAGESDPNSRSWWDAGAGALRDVREWSELVAGPRWKTFIRRFRWSGRARTAKFNYDPLSYSLNFDHGHHDHNGEPVLP